MRKLDGLLGLAVLTTLLGLATCKNARTTADTPPQIAAENSSSTEPSGFSGQIVEARESLYNNIYIYKDGFINRLTFGYNSKIFAESEYNTVDERDLPVPYTRFMTTAVLYPKTIKSILEIGSGGGRTAWYLHLYFPEAQITSVELDPAVTELAHKYFGIKEEPNFRTVTCDGRTFLAESAAKYDVILLDAYRGPFVPFHLLTKEFYRIVKEHLNEGGVVAQNIDPTTMLFDSAVNTIGEVFPHIEFYDAGGNNRGGSVVLVAYDDHRPSESDSARSSQPGKADLSAGIRPSLPDLSSVALKMQAERRFKYDLSEMLQHRFGLIELWLGQKRTYDVVDRTGKPTAGIDENAKVLFDDFAPVDALKAIQKHNQKWTQAAP
jgi:spermidine synthase